MMAAIKAAARVVQRLLTKSPMMAARLSTIRYYRNYDMHLFDQQKEKLTPQAFKTLLALAMKRLALVDLLLSRCFRLPGNSMEQLA